VDPGTIGLIGGIGGSVLGVLGGAIGTYFSVKNTAGPRERAFMIRAAALCWVAVATFLAALWWTPLPYQLWLWALYGISLPLAIRAGNRRQEQIRREEAAGAGSDGSGS
jgi:uncharacterized membrane protein